MTDEKRVLTIQDISCVGQCSLTVALPIISAAGTETAVLPSAVLSTHTGGDFKGFTFRDLTDDIPKITDHWEKQGIRFDAVYTGYLGNARQVDMILDLKGRVGKKGSLLIVDPAMADHGVLYTGFDAAFVEEMKRLAAMADILIPNLTEGAMLTGLPYKAEGYEEKEVEEMLRQLLALGAHAVVMTGVSFSSNKLGVAILKEGDSAPAYHFHERLTKNSHGTGDVFASSFTGALMAGKSVEEAAAIAADFTLLCLKETLPYPQHWYGVRFEKALPALIRALGL